MTPAQVFDLQIQVKEKERQEKLAAAALLAINEMGDDHAIKELEDGDMTIIE